MKKQAFHFSHFFLCLFFSFPLISFAQDSQSSFDKEFTWSDADETKTIYINIKKGADKIKMDFEGEISEGDLTVAAYDPEGNKVAWFSLSAAGSENSNVNVHISGNSHGNTNSNSNSNSTTNTSSGSNSTVTVTTTTTNDEEANGKSKNKSKVKNKNKNKTKTKSKHLHKNVERDGKNYSMVSTNSGSRGAKGLMKKRIDQPSPGKWKFVIEVDGVSGTLDAEIEQE